MVTCAASCGALPPLQFQTAVWVPTRLVAAFRWPKVTETGLAQRVCWPALSGQRLAAVSTGETSYTFPGAVARKRRSSRNSTLPVSPSTQSRQSPGGCRVMRSTRYTARTAVRNGRQPAVTLAGAADSVPPTIAERACASASSGPMAWDPAMVAGTSAAFTRNTFPADTPTTRSPPNTGRPSMRRPTWTAPTRPSGARPSKASSCRSVTPNAAP